MSGVREPWLLTPGPLTTSKSTKEAMLHDWGSRDTAFIEMNRRVRSALIDILNGRDSHVAVCMQGSGTFAIEAAIGTLISPSKSKLLVLINGAYGKRMVKICEVLNRNHCSLEWAEDQVPDVEQLDAYLADHPEVTHVAAVQCETTTGILNPIEAIAKVVSARDRRLIIDSMSAFGALALDASKVANDAVIASTNKCLEGVPGMGFVLVRKAALLECEGNAHSLALDLFEQWKYTEGNGQWRFTPPTHVIAAFDQALSEYHDNGSIAGRHARYQSNCELLVGEMRALGFETYLPDELQAPIIVTFRCPGDPRFEFGRFYDLLREAGYAIYPGKLTDEDTFRIGCIGRLDEAVITGAVEAIKRALETMGVQDCGPSL